MTTRAVPPRPARSLALGARLLVVFSEGTHAGDLRAVLHDLIDRRVWPAVLAEYGRLQATPRVIAAALAALGAGGLVARRRLPTSRPPRLLGIVEPRRIRRKARRRRFGPLRRS